MFTFINQPFVFTAVCADDETFDCARVNALFDVCTNTTRARKVCQKFCNLCDVGTNVKTQLFVLRMHIIINIESIKHFYLSLSVLILLIVVYGVIYEKT